MRRSIDANRALIMMSQTTDAMLGSAMATKKNADGICVVVDSAGNAEVTKGVTSQVAGWLVVHLIDSWNHNKNRLTANKVFTPCPIFADASNPPYCFDEVDVDNSTAELFQNDADGKPNMIAWL